MTKMTPADRRLRWLRSALAYTGSLHLKDFMDLFGIEKSQASRDKQKIAAEVEEIFQAPVKFGRHGVAQGATVHYPADQILPPRDILSEVLKERYVEAGHVMRKEPEQDILRAVVESIKEKRSVSVSYTTSEGITRRRTLQPHSVVDADGRLHARARDEDGRFKDFVMTRMSNPVLGKSHDVTFRNDPEWMRQESLVLRITDPDHPSATVMIKEYGLDEITGERRVKVRSAIMPYVKALYREGLYDGKYPIEVLREE